MHTFGADTDSWRVPGLSHHLRTLVAGTVAVTQETTGCSGAPDGQTVCVLLAGCRLPLCKGPCGPQVPLKPLCTTASDHDSYYKCANTQMLLSEVILSVKILAHQRKLDFHSILCLRWKERKHKYFMHISPPHCPHAHTRTHTYTCSHTCTHAHTHARTAMAV